jgi:hypothetical protein
MAKNRVFFPQEALDTWLVDNRVELANDELTIKSEGRRFKITEAVRVIREVTGTPDAYDLVGRVKSKVFLNALESEILETSMLIGDNAYDVSQGFLGMPVGTFAEHKASAQAATAQEAKAGGTPVPASDEELLGQFLLRVL